MQRLTYPSFVSSLSDDGNSWFYFISKEPGYYKFGITTSLRTRMKSHYRDFQFSRVDATVNCGCDAIMRAVETEFKQETAKRQILVRRYDKTEVIAVSDITPFVEWVQQRVLQLSLQPQPPNNRSDAKKDKKHIAKIELLKKLHEQDLAEITVLREKIKILEELLASQDDIMRI